MTDEPTSPEPFFEATRRDGVLELARDDTEWLSTGWQGGRTTADAAYNCTVPEDWQCEDVAAFVRSRLADAGFGDAEPAAGASDESGFGESGFGESGFGESGSGESGGGGASERVAGPDAAATGRAPTLLTGVAMEHARGARLGAVEAYATAGVSNPAALPIDPPGGELPDGEYVAGTVNVVVGTTRNLAPGAFANLVAVAAEARATTLLSRVGVPGTTSDAVVAASDPGGELASFSGSATRVGGAARACVREAVGAALDARYSGGDDPPTSPADARYGVSTDVRAAVFEP